MVTLVTAAPESRPFFVSLSLSAHPHCQHKQAVSPTNTTIGNHPGIKEAQVSILSSSAIPTKILGVYWVPPVRNIVQTHTQWTLGVRFGIESEAYLNDAVRCMCYESSTIFSILPITIVIWHRPLNFSGNYAYGK